MARVKQQQPRRGGGIAKAKKGPNRFSETRKKKDGTPARKPRARPGMAALREIYMYQGRTTRSTKKPKGKDPATTLLMPKRSMERLIREVLQNTPVLEGTRTVQRFQSKATEALHTAAEAYLTDLWTSGQIIACYSRRQACRFTDLALAQWFADTPMPARSSRGVPIVMPRPRSDRSSTVTIVVPPKKRAPIVPKQQTSKVIVKAPKVVKKLAGKVKLSKKDKLAAKAAKKRLLELAEETVESEAEAETDDGNGVAVDAEPEADGDGDEDDESATQVFSEAVEA
jgi:histone H3/H4